MSDSTSSTKQRPKRRRWLSFSIRGLMFMVLLFAVLLGWLGRDIYQHSREKSISKQIEATGGKVYWNGRIWSDDPFVSQFSDPFGPSLTRYQQWMVWAYGENLYDHIHSVEFFSAEKESLLTQFVGLPELNSLTIGRGKISDVSVDAIAQLRSLERLSFYHTEITPSQLKRLSKLPSLTTIDFQGTPDYLAALAHFPRLESITIRCDHLTKECIASLGNVRGLIEFDVGSESLQPIGKAELVALASLNQCQTLRIHDFSVDDQALEAISEMTSLSDLKIDTNAVNLSISNEGLNYLCKLTSLTRLSIPSAKFDDNSLEILSKLPSIEVISCEGSKVTDAGLKHLESLPNLNDLSIPGCQVSANAIRSLTTSTFLEHLDIGGRSKWQLDHVLTFIPARRRMQSVELLDDETDESPEVNPTGEGGIF